MSLRRREQTPKIFNPRLLSDSGKLDPKSVCTHLFELDNGPFFKIQALDKLITEVSTGITLTEKLDSPAIATIAQSCEWQHAEFFHAVKTFVLAGDLAKLAVTIDLMLYGVEQDMFKLGEFFLILEIVLESLPVQSLKRFWPVMETRKQEIIFGIEGLRPPGTTLLRSLVALFDRLDPIFDGELRGQVELFMLSAFDQNERLVKPGLSKNKLAILESSESGDFGLYCKVQASLADPGSVMASMESLNKLLDQITDLRDVFVVKLSLKKTDREYKPILISRRLFPKQVTDANFQFRVAAEILLFIEALLFLQPDKVNEYSTNKALKSLVWSRLVPDADTVKKIVDAKKLWFNVLREAAQELHFETIGMFIKREKEALAHKLAGSPGVAKEAAVDLESALNISLHEPHADKMGNMQLSKLWDQPLGVDDFVNAERSDTPAPKMLYEESRELGGEKREAARWLAVHLQRNRRWGMFKEPHGTSEMFGAPQTPIDEPMSDDVYTVEETPAQSTNETPVASDSPVASVAETPVVTTRGTPAASGTEDASAIETPEASETPAAETSEAAPDATPDAGPEHPPPEVEEQSPKRAKLA